MSDIFYDMVGKPIHVGDLFIIPGGNPRFGGLKLHLGLVVSKTDKTMTCDYFELPEGKPKGSGRKTPSKVLKIDPHYYLNYCKLFDELRERGNALKINTRD
jgi:hypothetical protein